MENTKFLSEQILTYIGNKRTLLHEIGKMIAPIATHKLVSLDLFSGSGIVSRYLKQFSSKIITNDLEHYSKIINDCFLTNSTDFNVELYNFYLRKLDAAIERYPIRGIISNFYSPSNEHDIKAYDRVFYTNRNALLIDSYRYYIEKLVPKSYQKFFLARLLIEASIHVNTSGVFKGFYKDKLTGLGKFGGSAENALNRIKGIITLTPPQLSNYSCIHQSYCEDANALVKKLDPVDLTYIDPPYNQHPYGSNYFMLNLILDNTLPSSISEVSGIPHKWNHSCYNYKKTALLSMEDLIQNLKSKFVLISYNNEGFISFDEMMTLLLKHGSVATKKIKYNTFRGARNLNSRSIHTNEFLFLLTKEK